MMLPGLIAVGFYRRKPSGLAIGLGLATTVVLSAVLGYYLPSGPWGREGSILLAVGGAVALYLAILAWIVYVYQPRRIARSGTAPPPASR